MEIVPHAKACCGGIEVILRIERSKSATAENIIMSAFVDKSEPITIENYHIRVRGHPFWDDKYAYIMVPNLTNEITPQQLVEAMAQLISAIVTGCDNHYETVRHYGEKYSSVTQMIGFPILHFHVCVALRKMQSTLTEPEFLPKLVEFEALPLYKDPILRHLIENMRI